MTKRKGTDAFTVSGGDASAVARTNPDNFRRTSARPAWPAAGSDYATWLAFHEANTPGGEFNELFARLDSGLEDALMHYGPEPTPGMKADTRRALCGKIFQVGGLNGNSGTSNLAHVTCAACLEAELARVAS